MSRKKKKNLEFRKDKQRLFGSSNMPKARYEKLIKENPSLLAHLKEVPPEHRSELATAVSE